MSCLMILAHQFLRYRTEKQANSSENSALATAVGSDNDDNDNDNHDVIIITTTALMTEVTADIKTVNVYEM